MAKGHRARLREKFIINGLNGFLDYEIVELLLTLTTPRKDCKQTAKALINKYNDLNGVLNANIKELENVFGVGPINSFGLKLIKEICVRYSSNEVSKNISLSSSEEIYKFLYPKLAFENKEHFVMICLDTKNHLIYEDISIGTLNSSLVHPREVFKSAIINNSSHIVVAHNHPSGDLTPSQADILTTRKLIEAGKIIGINLVDHLIISKLGYKSIIALA